MKKPVVPSLFPFPIWRFDENRRRYTTVPKGAFGELIWREHWHKAYVVGETRVSWLVSFSSTGPGQIKVSKRDLAAGKIAHQWTLTEEGVDDATWVHENAYRIGEAVRRTRDPEKLRRVAAIVGYEPRVRT
jgi:hypothetical protein